MASDPAQGFQRRDALLALPKPTIAAVRGPCLAGAFELALACDMTIASETAFFGEPELKFGAGIVAMWLSWLVGPKVAKEIIFLGEDRLLVERARDLGIVNRIVSDETLEAEVGRVARHLSAIDPNLLKLTKRAINQTLERQGLLDALETALAIDVEIEGRGSPDKLAFMEVARAQGLTVDTITGGNRERDQPAFRAQAIAVSDDEHAHHQLGINRRPADLAIVRLLARARRREPPSEIRQCA
jgi:enoyl-CoA hydratase/carnithine racemase